MEKNDPPCHQQGALPAGQRPTAMLKGPWLVSPSAPSLLCMGLCPNHTMAESKRGQTSPRLQLSYGRD